MGLGYVGLPLAMAAASAGLKVVGYDVSPNLVKTLTLGHSHIDDAPDSELDQALARGTSFSTELEHLRAADAIFIAVPSHLRHNRQPDMSFIEIAARYVASIARAGQAISLESTTYPGTIEGFLVAALEDPGLRVDSDIFVAFSPERVDPGNALGTADIPKVIGGVTPRSEEMAAAGYSRLANLIHPVSSARAAELTKLLENTYTSLNIALLNEPVQVAHGCDIDIWEVIEAAATKPFGFQPFDPGPGVAGHCIPLDLQFLAWGAREMRLATHFIDLAEEVNLHMLNFVVDRVTELPNHRHLPVASSGILGVGLAYKRDVADARVSPAIDVLNRLAQLGVAVGVLDPHVPDTRLSMLGYQIVRDESELDGWTIAVILTDDDDIDHEQIAHIVELVFDTRSVCGRQGLDYPDVVALSLLGDLP